MWGSNNGAGWAQINNFAAAAMFTTNAPKYQALIQYQGLNMVVCKIGVAAGTATTGDVMIIPATHSQPDRTNENNPLPEFLTVTPVVMANRAGMVIAATNTKHVAIIAGSDEYLGTMTFISDADTAFANTVADADYCGANG